MKKIQIEIPDKCSSKCVCYDTAQTPNGMIYHICRAFHRILKTTSHGVIGQPGDMRCTECQEALDCIEGSLEKVTG